MTVLEIILACTTVLFVGCYVFAQTGWSRALNGWSGALDRNRELIEILQDQQDHIDFLEADEFETAETMQ